MNIVKIEDWEVVGPNDPYRATETKYIQLRGKIYGHPKHEDGTQVTTSKVVNAEGRLVTTNSGTVYELGLVHPMYLAFLKGIGKEYDQWSPIKVFKEMQCL